MTIKIDGIAHHFDANETQYLEQELESIEETIYRVKLPEIKHRRLIPVSTRDHEGVTSISYKMLTKVGMAKIIANGAEDLPRSDFFMQKFTQAVKVLATSFGFTTEDLRNASMAGLALEDEKAVSARQSMMQKENLICWNGDAASGLVGITDNANVPIQAAAGVWSAATAAAIITDVSNAINKIRTQSKGLYSEGFTMILPIAQHHILSTTNLNTANSSNMTLLRYFLEPNNGFGISAIEWLPFEFDLAFTGADGAFIYQNDKDVIEQRIPLEMTVHPFQQKNLEFVAPIESKHGGVVIRRPMATAFLTGI